MIRSRLFPYDMAIVVGRNMTQRRGNEDRAVVEQLFREEYARIVVVLSAQLRDRGAAEECAQDAFVEAVKHWHKVQSYDDPKAWIWLVALRRAAKWRARHARGQVAFAAPEPPAPELAVLIDLHDAIRRLPNRQREVVTLHYFADLGVSAIAAQLRISEGTVKSQLHDARNALRGAQDEPRTH
jgi:RNA polymerase sigma-70 factor, ECF subfamily